MHTHCYLPFAPSHSHSHPRTLSRGSTRSRSLTLTTFTFTHTMHHVCRGAQVRYGGQQISFKLDAFVSYGSSDPITLARIAIRYSGVPPTTPQKRHLHTLDSSVMRLILSSTHWSRDHFAKKNVALAIHGALAAALSAVGSFQRQISFVAPFWCVGRAECEVLCALAYAHPACRSARRC